MLNLVDIIILGALIALSAFFGGVEVALVAVSEIKVEQLAKRGVTGSAALKRLKKNPTRMFATVMIGNNLVNIGAAAYATEIAINMFDSLGVGISTGVMAFIILVFGEITPKAYFNAHSEKLALLFARPLEILSYILYPFVLFFERISKSIIPKSYGHQNPIITPDELEAILDVSTREKAIEEGESNMIRGVLGLNDRTVRAVMTPRTKMFCLDSKNILNKSLSQINRYGYSRIPITEGSKDRVVGVLNTRDVLRYLEKGNIDAKLKNIAKKPFFVSHETILSDLFKEFQKRRIHMGIVIDEFGGVEGLVTIEDLVEEIVGEVLDEKDISPTSIIRVNKNTIIVHGDTEIDMVNEYLRVDIPEEEDYSTISGLLHVKLHDLPEVGDFLLIEPVALTVEEVFENKPVKIRIEKKSKNETINN